MIFKKIGNMENVEAICHYYVSHKGLSRPDASFAKIEKFW